MSIVVGLVNKGRVWIGGDSMMTGGCHYDIRNHGKTWACGEFVMGATGWPRVQDVATFCFDPPKIGDMEPRRYMVAAFVPALRAALEAAGVPPSPISESNWSLMVGVRGRLFVVYDDWQVEETDSGYSAIGCAARAGIAALHVLASMGRESVCYLDGESAIRTALAAVESSDAHVRAPFTVVGTA